jgi:hypothetical protein
MVIGKWFGKRRDGGRAGPRQLFGDCRELSSHAAKTVRCGR